MADPGADAVALLSELVSIDSVNPGLIAGSAGEQGIADHLSARLERSGFTANVVPAHGHADWPSLVAVSLGPADGPTVILNRHLDTVGVTGMTDPFTPGSRAIGHTGGALRT